MIEKHKVSIFYTAPTAIRSLIKASETTPATHPKNYDLSSLRSLIYGASPISEALVDRAALTLPRTEFRQGYGLTEMSPVVAFLQPQYHTGEGRALGKICSAGRPSYVAEVRIEDPEGHPLPTGEVGEIVAKGPGMMLGYWNRPEESAHALRGGWMHTGDAGFMDKDGFLFLVDRIKDMIVTGGENVYSAEVENALHHHPAVALCAVFGIPADKWGEAVHAVVVLNRTRYVG